MTVFLPGSRNDSRDGQTLSWAGIVTGIVLCLVYLHFFAFKAHVDLGLTLHEPGRSWFKIYWADESGGFSERDMQRVLVGPRIQHYRFSIGSLDGIKHLRIDPVERKTTVTLNHLTITQTGFDTIALSPENRFSGLEPVSHIGEVTAAEDGLRFQTTGRDSQFELALDTTRSFPLVHIVAVLTILATSLLIPRTVGFLARDLGYVPVLLAAAVILALVMAAISEHYRLHPNGKARLYVHPDEEVHVAAVKYYRDHLWPPEIDDPAIRDTFSVYGYSRLASYELYYPVAGYLVRLLSPLRNFYMWDARLVSVLFLALMTWLAWRRALFRPIALPLLVSAQVWYLYSYSNSDGFALMLAMLAAYQAACPGSTMNRLLTETRPAGFWFHAIWLGLLAGALLLSKQNFYFFLLFLGLYFLWRLAIGDFPDYKLFWRRLFVIGFIAVGVFGLRFGLDVAINGPDTRQKQLEMVETRAAPLYRPSTELHRKHITLNMKQRGVSLERLIEGERWAARAFASSFGSYGYSGFLASETFFSLVKFVGLALLGVLTLSVLVYAPVSVHWLFGITVLCGGLLTAAAVWVSWTISFQPQGRYLAPILPMLGILYFHLRPFIERRATGALINGLVLALFALAVYSFVYIGLGLVQKL